MAIIEKVREYIQSCPLLDSMGSIGVEFLPSETGSFSIEETPTELVTRTFVDGSEERQFAFIFASRFMYSDEAIMCIDNSGWFESFANWLIDQNDIGNLPELGEKMNATKIEVTTSGYLFGISQGMRDARYQVQCRLIYEYERN